MISFSEKQRKMVEFAALVGQVVRLTNHGNPFTVARTLAEIDKRGRILHRIYERQGDGYHDEEDEACDLRKERLQEHKILTLGKEIGVRVNFQSDPRGLPIVVSWGKGAFECTSLGGRL